MEKYLQGKLLFKNDTLQCALKIMKSEVIVTDNPPEPSVAYRKILALGLFFKVRIIKGKELIII